MAKTLLNGVNEVLKKSQLIQGTDGELSTLVDSARQHFIDAIVQAWNESIEELYSISEKPFPQEMVQSTITLATGDRSYPLDDALVELRFPLIEQINGYLIEEYPGGFDQVRQDQFIPTNFTGRPGFAAISPINGELYMDFIPTANENGLEYQYWYDKDVSLSAAADAMPFKDAVFRAMVPVVAEMYARNRNRDFDAGAFTLGLGRASRLLRQMPARDSWVARRGVVGFDPFHA